MKSPRLWIAAAALATALLLPLLGFLRARAFLSGEEFQTLAAHHAGSALGGAAKFAPIRWSGPAASSDTLRVTGSPQSPLRQLEANNLRASWNWRAIFSGVWHIEQITADSLSATIGPPIGLESASTIPEPLDSPAFLPRRFELGPVKIRRANLDFEGAKIQDATLEIQRRHNAWSFSGYGGKLAIPHWPVLALESFQARWTPNQLRIDSAALHHGTGGLVTASGNWPGTLQLDYSGIELSSLLTPPWRGLLNGTLSGNATIAPHHSTGRFELTQAVLQGMEWLDLLASLTGRSDLQRLRISKATGSFAVHDSSWLWSDLVVESSGLLRVEGTVRVSADKHLSGDLRLGVAPSLLQSLPGASDKIFIDSHDGFLWTPVALGGTLDTPTENLTPRLAAAAGEQAIEAVQPLLEAVPGRAREAVGDTINSLFDLLGR